MRRTVIEKQEGVKIIYGSSKIQPRKWPTPAVKTRSKVTYKSTKQTHVKSKPIFTVISNSNYNVADSDIQVYGIKRSGHHAIIFWILGHYKSYHYYNNCWINRKKVSALEFYKLIKGVEKPIVLSSFEDRQDHLKKSSIVNLGNYLKLPRMTRVLIIRDPFNNYASRFKLGKEFSSIFKQTSMWKETAREYLGITNHLGDKVIKVNYNQWFKDISYRKELSTNFGVFTDNNYSYVPEIGGGSSFDHRKYNGKSDEMHILQRWRKYINDPVFCQTILKDEELMDLSARIFGNIFKI